MTLGKRADNEIKHGKKLFASGAEQVWGWGTTAGKIRFMRRANWIIENAQLKPGIKVLEIGCGTGNFTEQFSSSQSEILAVDISSSLLDIAVDRNLQKNIKFLCQPFETLDNNSSFDAIIGSSVLHHLEIKPALIKIYELLKPGGLIAFAEPNMLNPQIMAQKNIPWIKERAGDSPNETAFFKWLMKSYLTKAGFHNILVKPLDWLHPSIPERYISLSLKAESFLQRIPIVRELAGSLYIKAQKPY